MLQKKRHIGNHCVRWRRAERSAGELKRSAIHSGERISGIKYFFLSFPSVYLSLGRGSARRGSLLCRSRRLITHCRGDAAKAFVQQGCISWGSWQRRRRDRGRSGGNLLLGTSPAATPPEGGGGALIKRKKILLMLRYKKLC